MAYAEKTALGWDEIMTGVEGKEWRYEIQHGKKELGKIYVLKDVYMNDEPNTIYTGKLSTP